MIELPGLWSLTPIGFGLGVVAIVYWLLISGRLIPRSSHERELAVSNKRGDEWKETANTFRDANAILLGQNGDLIEGGKVVEAFLRASGPSQGDTQRSGGA